MTNNEFNISIIVPMFNEGENVNVFYERMTNLLNSYGYNYTIICINDGSKDDTMERLRIVASQDKRVKVINLSRNFGKEIAMSAGLHYSQSDIVIPIDADLQDPPEVIPLLIEKWKEGYDVVYATRLKREGETWFKKFTAHFFYRVIGKMTRFEIPADTGDFRLMTKQVVEALNKLPEQHRFMKGLFSWVGFKQTSISYYREPRYAGKSSFNYWKLWNFAIEGITSFSFAPLQIATYLGLVIAGLSLLYAIYLIVATITLGNAVAGYPSLMVAILFFGGVQLMTLGLIGEYVGRIYNESKRRPLYLVKEEINVETSQGSFELTLLK
ncbi:glycosyltransferase family 2 protein [Paenibacillus polymyxa]|jgi:glycosyltransferase involved in cell wall biosynthesis|uniref:glycosyltransferase family 2 protein n=1 Tax=Paenibacillus polymyxa TaxID=1406 RepID=UPI000F86111D|nr:glycosyltransferase family 2 protein [Paenibacillus polymyxa]MBY0022431.1 glycosyltransferase family 2 protein [Paenibacillus polymyxa]MBY0058274.1 glycosyltransferase family 2 protein [Paenibacillus polymyxa]MBY0068887.1 glycosyltransferase family 2 protein [Paenibacillus polymyxa]MBY0079454.1 glycosyltransferase family 2 protein [Paenibacillus polymyxa]MBZ6444046.1 glycosyltransferase family 2 protein [Paenibacillus polymyxa]